MSHSTPWTELKPRKEQRKHWVHQQVLIDLHVAVVVCQVARAVQRRKPAVVALVDLRAVVEQVVQLRHRQTSAKLSPLACPRSAAKLTMSS